MPSIPATLRCLRRSAVIAAGLALAAAAGVEQQRPFGFDVDLGKRRGGPQANEHRLPVVCRREQLRRADACRRRRPRRHRGAKITVFDANNGPKAQFAQLQTAATSKQYSAIITQPIFGTGLISEVKVAIKNGVKVVNMDQIRAEPLDLPAAGPGSLRERRLCPHEHRDQARRPCGPGMQGEEPQPVQRRIPLRHQGIRARRCDPQRLQQGRQGTSSLKVVAEGESFFTPSKGLRPSRR